ncbi:MAG: hypothetical protein ABWY05_08535, partial [Noviherbaspirillum sp.]
LAQRDRFNGTIWHQRFRLLFGLSTNNNALRHGIADLIHEISGLEPHLTSALDNNEDAAVSWLLKYALEQRQEMPFEVLREAIAASNVRRIELLVGHPRLSDAFSNHKVERSILHYAIRKAAWTPSASC